MIEVRDHWLHWDEPGVELVRKLELPNRPAITPSLIVVHYGVTRALPELLAAQRARGYWAHLSIDGFTSPTGRGAVYQVHQALPFDRKGIHAGESFWDGRANCNDFSIGIEISNPGPLLVGAGGGLRTVHGHVWPDDEAVEARHKHKPSPPNWNHWAIYTDQEVDILIGVCRALAAAYPTITDIAGHDDISPGRKWDPGPALNMTWLREKIFA